MRNRHNGNGINTIAPRKFARQLPSLDPLVQSSSASSTSAIWAIFPSARPAGEASPKWPSQTQAHTTQVCLYFATVPAAVAGRTCLVTVGSQALTLKMSIGDFQPPGWAIPATPTCTPVEPQLDRASLPPTSLSVDGLIGTRLRESYCLPQTCDLGSQPLVKIARQITSLSHTTA